MFIDVQPNEWYYNEVIEAANLMMEDGEPFIKGIPYNIFEEGKPYHYEEQIAGAEQKQFTISVGVTPTADNPIFVYIDNVQTVYKKVENKGETTVVELYSKVRTGANVTIACYGVPKVNEFKKPVQANLIDLRYPNARLVGIHNYKYYPFAQGKREQVVVLGVTLRRANIPDSLWEDYPNDRQKILREYIGHDNDKYYIASDGVVHLPYSMNRVTANVSFLTDEGGWVKQNHMKVHCDSNNVLHANRIFPKANITRAEMFTLVNRLRKTIYARFTDTEAATHDMRISKKSYLGQRVISTEGRYRPGRGELRVYLDGKRIWENVDYVERDEYSIVLNKPIDKDIDIEIDYSRFHSHTLEDVGKITYNHRVDTGKTSKVNGLVLAPQGQESWWAGHILDLENEMYDNNPIVQGLPIRYSYNDTVDVNKDMSPTHQGSGGMEQQWFMPNSFVTRAQAATLMNRFRKMIIERLV